MPALIIFYRRGFFTAEYKKDFHYAESSRAFITPNNSAISAKQKTQCLGGKKSHDPIALTSLEDLTIEKFDTFVKKYE